MADHTTETQAALSMLEKRFDALSIGALGFSQAGWVLPTLTYEDADFLVLLARGLMQKQSAKSSPRKT